MGSKVPKCCPQDVDWMPVRRSNLRMASACPARPAVHLPLRQNCTYIRIRFTVEWCRNTYRETPKSVPNSSKTQASVAPANYRCN